MSRQADIEAIQRGLPSSAPAASDLLPAGSQLEQLIDELEKYFKPVVIKPESSLAEMQYSGGQQSIIAYLRTKASKQRGAR